MASPVDQIIDSLVHAVDEESDDCVIIAVLTPQQAAAQKKQRLITDYMASKAADVASNKRSSDEPSPPAKSRCTIPALTVEDELRMVDDYEAYIEYLFLNPDES